MDSPYSIVVAPGIIFRIQDHAKRLNMDEASLKELFSEAWSRIRPKLPFHYLDEQTSFECLLATFDNEQDYEKYIRKVIEKAYKALDKNELRRKGLKVLSVFVNSRKMFNLFICT